MEANTENLKVIQPKGQFDGTVALLLAGSLYLLLGMIFNQYLQADLRFGIPAVLAGVLGLYGAYLLNSRQATKSSLTISLVAIIIGFIVTFLLFLIGIIPLVTGETLFGITGSAWIIFALAAYWLYRNRNQAKS